MTTVTCIYEYQQKILLLHKAGYLGYETITAERRSQDNSSIAIIRTNTKNNIGIALDRKKYIQIYSDNNQKIYKAEFTEEPNISLTSKHSSYVIVDPIEAVGLPLTIGLDEIIKKHFVTNKGIGRYQRPINSYFFDEETPDMWYVLGAFYGSYVQSNKKNSIFRDSNKSLVQIVMQKMECNRSIIKDNREKSSYRFEIPNNAHLISRLEYFGLEKPKKERTVPNIPSDYAADFCRGFIDSTAVITNINRHTFLRINYQNKFLRQFVKLLSDYTNCSLKHPKIDTVLYSHKDAMKIREFIYQNNNYIIGHKIGLHTNIKKLCKNKKFVIPPRPNHIKKIKKMERTKKLLLKGHTPTEIAEKLEYASVLCLYIAFKNSFGKTIKQWKAEQIRI